MRETESDAEVWVNQGPKRRDPVAENLHHLSWRDRVRIWCGWLPESFSPGIRREIQQRTNTIALQGWTSSHVIMFFAWLIVIALMMYDSASGRAWSLLGIPLFLYGNFLIFMLRRRNNRGEVSRATYYRWVTPYVVFAGVVAGSIPLAVGPDNLGLFFLALTIVMFLCLAGPSWLTGYWPLVMLYCAIQVLLMFYATSHFNIPDAMVIDVLAGVMFFMVFGLTVVGSSVLTRGLLQTIMARDRQALVDLLLQDYERGGHDWIWETDEDLVFRVVPSRMLTAACGDPRVRPGASLIGLIDGDQKAAAAIAASRPFEAVVSTTCPDGDAGCHRDGQIRLWGRPNLVSGKCLGYRGVGTDQGALQRMADAERTAERFDAMVALTSGITHDFNNQLATVMGAVELARIPASGSDEVLALLDRAADACLRSRSMTADLSVALGLHAPTDPVDFDVRPEVQRVIADVAPLYPEVSIELSCEVAVYAKADPNHFRRAVRNLVENACQANAQNPDTTNDVRVVLVPVVTESGPMACVRVSDDGPGVDPVLMQRIFEPFFTTRTGSGGTGLGLPVALGFCRQAGGSLSLEPSIKGATFVLHMPLASAADDVGDSISGELPALVDSRRLGGAFLVVEDDESVAAILTELVETFGAKADWVSTVADGISRLCDPDNVYRCVISDIVLPDGEGFSVIAALRERFPDTPAIYVSGFSKTLPSAVDEVLRCPLVAKPFSSSELLHALATVGVVESRTEATDRDELASTAS